MIGEDALGDVLVRHYAGRPDWGTVERLRGWLATGEAQGSERRAIRETFQSLDSRTGDDPWEIRSIVEEEGLDAGKTRRLLLACEVTNEKILRWLDEEADRVRQKADKTQRGALDTSNGDRSRSQPPRQPAGTGAAKARSSR